MESDCNQRIDWIVYSFSAIIIVTHKNGCSLLVKDLKFRICAQVPPNEKELLLRAFLASLRRGSWSVTGDLIGTRSRPVAGKTIKGAASNLASAFRRRVERSPLHVQDGTDLRPTLRELLRAFNNVDPPTNRQKAITPRFLRAVFLNGRRRRDNSILYRHASDLIIAAFFFACRSCEYTVTPQPGVTRRLMLRNVKFRDKHGVTIHHDDPDLRIRAAKVTVCFEDQKNRHKHEYRTQFKTGDRLLCPVLRLISVIERIYLHVPNPTPSTSLCATIDDSLQTVLIDNSFTLSYLRSTCLDFGGSYHFGFDPMEIGNKSLRSGAAMSMFLARRSPETIMLMGRWRSLSFMDYLRPQVLEWTTTLSMDMIRLEHFFEPQTPCLHPRSHTDNGRSENHMVISGFNVDFDK